MKQKVLEQLEWGLILQQLEKGCATTRGKQRSLELSPQLDRDEIKQRWSLVEPLTQLIQQGYLPPIGEIPDLLPILRAVDVGQALNGEDLRSLYSLLNTVRNVHKFCLDFSGKCQTLRFFHARTYPLPRIMSEIERTIGPDGELLDDASKELMQIRQSKLGLRKRIESTIKSLFQDQELIKYLQDDFFTLRSERYVVPIKLDGRGRVKGSIYDTSDSGQTLFIEPSVVAPLNEELLELELSEKLEILRIFRDLGEKIRCDIEIVRQNYTEIIELDFLLSQAKLAHQMDARSIDILENPCVDLKSARHPILCLEKDRKVIANDIGLDSEQRVLVISGPNAGGKTVVLKTVGLIHIMAKAGLLVPADESSKIYLYESVHLEMGDAQNLTANLSTFSGHVMGLKPIVTHATAKDLVLLDEIAAGTEPQTGAALAQAILEDLAAKDVNTVATTHFDALKGLAIEQKLFRNGSMEYSSKSLKPTYRLVLDIPGQSYGIELAEQIGLPERIIARARSLRGTQAEQFDRILSDISDARIELRQKNAEVEARALELEQEKIYWEEQRGSLEQQRQKALAATAARLEEEVSELRENFSNTHEALRKKLKHFEKEHPNAEDREEIHGLRKHAEKDLEKIRSIIKANQLNAIESKGRVPEFTELKEKQKVFVKSLAKEATITKLGASAEHAIEVKIGLLNSHVPLQDILLLNPEPNKAKEKISGGAPLKKHRIPKPTIEPLKGKDIPFTPQTSTNTIDLRGTDVEAALAKMWRFIDQSLLSGKGRILIVHGHGQNKLKAALRDALAKDSPYKLGFRPGEDGEGGDGVTVVSF